MNSPFLIFDRNLKRNQHRRAASTLPAADFLYREVAHRLAERLEGINRTFPVAIDLGARGGLLHKLLKQYTSITHLFGSDITTAWATDFIGDEEYLPLKPGSVNLITSLLNLHWVNDLPGTLLQIRQSLAPDGLFLASLFGGQTLQELRQAQIAAESELYDGASPRISPFADVRDAAALLQRAGFALPVADTETITVHYPDALTLLRDLKAMGEQNALLKRPGGLMSRRLLNRIAEKYQALFQTPEGLPATFEIITLTGWNETSGRRTP